ncbi:Bug family tripartite tricarboxylate transporter substrate binding protein [Hydrogenophaga sp. BPS33]|uniref:Bug family tripartite tricarboxylate transporter substrate binding protein n=1 Tax=Hydrogenophaga sp. BPS33 TaxID=2651974 RepID=UPI001320018C|nr:tripartite tricarboxylate transporter substrate-binding protein [Hydrogenophaga sp. BPS33]QHE86910.1 tripartite tricarboxylate transporter substrate binding protein [Hydrogenophaga sp. BPS33]
MTARITRRALAVALALGAAVFASAAAHAQSYPSRAVKFIVPVPAGGAADMMSRLIAAHLQAKLGQPFVVENRPGAGSSLGMDVVAKAAPDGYTIGMGNIAANAINPAVRPAAFPYQPVKDFAAISMVGVTPLVFVVNAEKVQATNLASFITFLKANPGKLSYGSSGVGSSLHLAMELFLMRTGTSMIHVPYKGSAPMVAELIGGQIEASIDAATTSLPQVKAGKFRALGVSTKERAFFAPEVPPIADTVPGFDVSPWHGVVAPAGTPQAIVDKLSTEIQAFLRQPDTEAKLRDAGVVRVGSSAKDFQQAMQADFDLYTKVVKDAGVKAD